MARFIRLKYLLSLIPLLLPLLVSAQTQNTDRRKAVTFIRSVSAHQAPEGTGFIVHPSGYVVTAGHNIGSAKEDQIEIHIGERDGPLASVTAIYNDPKRDLAILKLQTLPAPYAFLSVASEFSPDLNNEGDKGVILMGFPLNLRLSSPSGEINTTSEPNGLWSVDGTNDHGMSGGPVVLKRTARVIGVLNTKDLSAGFAKMVPINEKDEFLKSKIDDWPPVSEMLGKLVLFNLDGSAEVSVRGTG